MEITDIPALEAPVTDKEDRIRELVGQIRAGSPEAFEELLRLHERRVLGTAIQMGLSPADAQDACQEVFLRVFRYLPGFRIGLSFESWLWRIVVNVVYDSLRRRHSRGEVSWEGVLGDGELLQRRSTGLQISVENADLCEKLLSRMVVLTPQERMVFVLRDLQDVETKEVAKAMGISRITVRRHGASARAKLRLVLEEFSAKTRTEPEES